MNHLTSTLLTARENFVVGDSHLKRLSKQLFNYSMGDTRAVIKILTAQ